MTTEFLFAKLMIVEWVSPIYRRTSKLWERRPLAIVEASFLLIFCFFKNMIELEKNPFCYERGWELVPTQHVVLGFNFPSPFHNRYYMISFSKKRKFLLTLLFSGGIFLFLSFPVLADELGDKNSFYVDSYYDWKERTQITATLKKISDKAYFYIEDEYWSGLSIAQQNLYLEYLNKTAENFDDTTHPSMHYIFGSEWDPGIDNDSRITILLSRLKSNAGGYFNPKDEFSKEDQPTSNQREMIYVNSTQIANSLIDSFFSHEFQHLINWNQKERMQGIVEEVWLNELRSEYAPTVAGYDAEYVGTNLERRVDDFSAYPFDSLTEWQGTKYDYPPISVFGHYLADQFSEDIFTYMIQNNKIGIYSIEQAVKDKGYNFTFSQVFNNWLIASYLNDSSLSDGRYGYKNPYLKGVIHVSPISYSIVSTSIINISQNVKNWAPYWYRFINKQDSSAIAKDLEIEFEASPDKGDFNVIYIVDYFLKPAAVGLLNLQGQKGILKIPDFKDNVESVVIIVSNQFKKSGFIVNEPSSPFILSLATTIFQEPVPPIEPVPNPTGMARPGDYGLKEGDLIRAQGDFDIFIINQYGYKRLFLNPAIFNMYGHLGTWKDVKTVTPATRDAFITSSHYRYVNEDKVYHLEVTGEDIGILHWINMTAENFLAQGGKANAIFTINKSELDWYPKGADKTSL